MGGPSPGSASTGSGSVTAVGVSGAGAGTGAATIAGTPSASSVSRAAGGSGPEANRTGSSITLASASSPALVREASPARPCQLPYTLPSEISAAGRYTSAVVPPSSGLLSV